MKRISSYKIMAIASIALGASLVVGTTYAAFAVTDNAQPKSVKIGLGEIGGSTVKFLNYDGSVFKSEEVLEGETLSSVPGTPVHSDSLYTFDGWTTDSSSYAKTNDDFATKTYSVDTTYYPRFVSYGYKTSTGNPAPIPNKWDINNNFSFDASTRLILGTYICGATSLENPTSQITLSMGGQYALVCGETAQTAHDSKWDAEHSPGYSSDLNHWFVEKYVTLTRNNIWTNEKLCVRSYDSVFDGSNKKDIFISAHETTNYVYVPYNYTKITFGAVYNDNNSSINADWSNVQYRSNDLSVGNGTSFAVPNQARNYWDPSVGENYRIKFTLPDWGGVYRPRIHYWFNNGVGYSVDYSSGLFNYEAESNMTQLSGSTYYLDIDTKLPLTGMIVIFDQWDGSKHVKKSNDIALTALNGAGNYTINGGGYSSWAGETWSGDVGTNQFNGATLTKDS